jgi:hypothetical protein
MHFGILRPAGAGFRMTMGALHGLGMTFIYWLRLLGNMESESRMILTFYFSAEF